MQQNQNYPLHQMNPFLLTVILAILYIITAKIGFLLALPPGNVTSLWPPSGISLAATILFGWWATLGIWIGACAVNLWTIDSDLTAQISTTIAMGSSIQAIACAQTLRWANRFNTRHNKTIPVTSDTISFILICAASCTIAASIGVGSLLMAKIITAEQFSGLWLTWWLGDYSGMLLITPCILVLHHLKARSLERHLLFKALPNILLGFLLVLFTLSWQLNNKAFQKTLDQEANQLKHLLENKTLTILQQVKIVGDFVYTAPDLDNQSFQKNARSILTNNPSISTLSWSPQIKRTELNDNIALAKKQGIENFHIYQIDLVGKKKDADLSRNTFYPVFYLASNADSATIIGFDNGSETNRLATLNLARDSGKIAATGLIRPLQNPDNNNFILFFQPVYKNPGKQTSAASNAPTKTLQRRNTLRGFVVGLVNLEKLLSLTLNSRQSSNIQLWEVTRSSQPTLLTSTMIETEKKNIESSSATFNVANRVWRIDVYPTESQLSEFNQLKAWLITGLGIAIAALFIVIIIYLEKLSRPTDH